jgi:hypothetical protein
MGHVTCMGDVITYKILVRKPDGKRPNERPQHKW